jgi:hypothetical protein
VRQVILSHLSKVFILSYQTGSFDIISLYYTFRIVCASLLNTLRNGSLLIPVCARATLLFYARAAPTSFYLRAHRLFMCACFLALRNDLVSLYLRFGTLFPFLLSFLRLRCGVTIPFRESDYRTSKYPVWVFLPLL